MAKAKNKSEQPTVTRIKARSDKKPAPKQAKITKKATSSVSSQGEPKSNFVKKFLGYFSGAWFELRQVRWPTRRATWGMTAALLIFTGLFAGFILLIDLLWEYLFKLLIG